MSTRVLRTTIDILATARRCARSARSAWLCGITLLLHGLIGHALAPDKPFRHYVADRWGIEDGLPQLSVLSVTQDATGYLWITTQNGVARFDGVQFRVFNVENTPALRANIIERAVLGADGSLWFGSTRGLTRFVDGVWSAVDLVPGDDVNVSALSNDLDGRLLVGTDHGLFRIDAGAVEQIGLAQKSVQGLTRIGTTIYAGSERSIFELRAGRSIEHPLPGAEDAPAVNTLLAVPDELLVGTRRGIFSWRNGQWLAPDWARELAQHRIETLFRDSDGNLWIGTTEGLYRYHEISGLERCLIAELPGTAWIASFFEDREGNLWIGSLTHSLLRVWNGWVARLNADDGLSDPFVWSVVSDESGRVWIGTNTGVEEMSPNGAVRLIASTRELPDSSVYNLFRTQGGELLIGTRSGLASWNGQELGRDPTWEPIANASIRAIVEEDPGHLWIGTDQGLYEQTGEKLVLHGAAEGLTEGRVRALTQSQRGELWVGTERGLFRGVEGRFRRLDQPAELAPALVTAILPWRGARMAIATMDAGLFVGSPGKFRQITTAQGLPYNSAFALAIEGSWLYVTSPEGVYRIALADLDRYQLEGGRVSSDMVIQTGSQYPGALRARCCNGGAQARIARANGMLWLPTLEGLLGLDTTRIRRSPLSPPAVAEVIEHMGVSYEGSGPFQLDGSNGDVAIHFTGLSLQDPMGLRFHYRLIGYDERWRSSGDRRVVYYTNLAPGHYQFEAVASSGGLDSPSPAALTFNLIPPFYRALWFKIVIGLSVLALGVLAWLGYRHRIEAREQALEQQIRQRTEELDRANERLRSANRALLEESHTDALTGLRNRRFLAHYMAEWRRDSSLQRPQRLAFILIDLDYFKRVNDAHGHLAGDEVLRQLAAVLVEVAEEPGFPLRWGGEEFMLVMPAEAVAEPAQYCEHLRSRIASKAFVHSRDQLTQLTASIGFALFPALADRSDADDWNLALELADAGLYLIKSGGRNGWAVVHARAHARAIDFGTGFSGRLRALTASGMVIVEASTPIKTRAPLATDTH
jgi:diguanylate cyclase (GGDEF)-like protein